MRTIYIDYDFKCHIDADEAMTSVDTDLFDNKCKAYIEGHRFVPIGYQWIREDGAIFYGEMVAPWKKYSELNEAQRVYEHEQYLSSLEKDTQYINAYNEGVQEA